MEKYYVTVDDGEIRWYKDAKRTTLHREDGPALQMKNGAQYWVKNGCNHREDGPAGVTPDGTKEWWANGKLHCETGPAIEYADGRRSWFINGKKLTEAEFNARNQPACVDKTITIDGVNYKLTKI